MNTIKLNTIGTPCKAEGSGNSGGGSTGGGGGNTQGDIQMIGDGNTHFYVQLYDKNSLGFAFKLRQSQSQGVQINWGDGSEVEIFDEISYKTLKHSYTKTGIYRITLSPIEDSTIILGGSSTTNRVIYDLLSYINSGSNEAKLICIELGRNVEIKEHAFYYAKRLKKVFFSEPNIMVENDPFKGCDSIEYGMVPFNYSSNLYNGTKVLHQLNIIEGVKEIKDGLCSSRYIVTIVFPKTIERIESNAFSYANSVLLFDFSTHIFIPELENSNAFNTGYAASFGGGKIVVPNALYDEWINATNWSSIASYIIKKSEWDAQNA